MKFVHLTGRKSIGRIKRNGIRMGSGRRGRGIYAMPLFLISKDVFTDHKLWPHSSVVASDPVSTGRFWSFLFPDSRKGESKAAAVVFSLPDNCWPIALHIQLTPEVGPSFLDWLNRHDGNEIVISKKDVAFASAAFAESSCADIKLVVGSGKALGGALHQYQLIGGRPTYRDEIEVVIPSPIPASCVERVVPLYRSNSERKSRRGKARTVLP